MSKVKFYGYKNCSTCKKALGFLGKRQVAFEDVDITSTPPAKKELKSMLARYDGKLKRLFNISGQMYREMELGKKLDGMTEDEALDLLAKNGKLVKRPFLIVDGKAVACGFDEEEWAGAIPAARR